MIKNKVKKELGEEIFSEALAIFLAQSAKDMMLLNLYCESKDYSNAQLMSHKLIGTFEAIGVKRIPSVVKSLDEGLKNRHLNKSVLIDLNEEYINLKTFIKEEYSLETQA